MTASLLVTLFLEGLVISAYSLWRKKPLLSLLLTGSAANLITQTLLWMVLNVFFQHYLAALILAEILIWLIESVLLALVPSNRLSVSQAILLSLGMNLTSFTLGWYLPA